MAARCDDIVLPLPVPQSVNGDDDPSKESTVDAFVLDPSSDPTTNEDATTYQHTLNGNADDNLLGFNTFTWDANSLIADYDHGLGVYAADDQLGWDVGGLGGEAPLFFSILDVRIDEMLRVLWATHDDLFRNVASGRPAFDMELAKSVFTSNNTRQYLSAFLHRCHHEIPVVHRPTFSVETASTALLLAMVMIGSMFCAPRDDTFSARRFIGIAEEFIYNQELFTRHPRHFQNRAAEAHPEDIQTVQAALIIAILQSGMNDIQTRRRIRVQRHPQLVAVVRSLDLPSSRHRPSPSWHEFIADEVRVRLATYTFLFDAHLTLFLAHPPSMSLAEMTGALPSPSTLFEASTPSDHARLSAAQLAAPPAPLSLSHWVSGLLSETPWPTCPSSPPSAPHLYLALQALQAVAHTARATGLGATSGAFAAVLRAADRWEQLWRRADVDADKSPADRSVRHAFLRHAAESCWLVRTVVRVAQAGGRAEGGGGAYMRCVGTDSYADVHGFIERPRDAVKVPQRTLRIEKQRSTCFEFP
ncbi:ATPase P-type K/Mg/Cd/Cu/Zn/Na/Ca/Na/H-transporter [Neofusicoccum parvum]|nr:ATPase P-type K/Mg/Cd/Cu/Zn/Na/Ca/Na/H-transporter [Neofusicoccum parvum]